MWKKGGMGFFLAANISLKCPETYSLGGCIGPGLEQILSCTSTLNFVPHGLYAGRGWGAKAQLRHPEDPPFPVLAAAREVAWGYQVDIFLVCSFFLCSFFLPPSLSFYSSLPLTAHHWWLHYLPVHSLKMLLFLWQWKTPKYPPWLCPWSHGNI